MRKVSKLLLAGVVTLSATLTGFAGCGGKTGPKVDKTKAQLYVGNMYAGFRDEWLQKWRKDFEELHKDTKFEDGKVGVQVWIDNKRDAYAGKTLISSIASYDKDVYFTEEAYMYEYVASDACAKITDIVTEDLTEKYGESGSIADKMNADAREYYNLNGDYYMLPLNETYFGIIYDADLFASKGFYISNKSTATSTKFTKVKEDFSAGIDNVVGTYDDGLPTTYAQFYDLLEKMKSSTVTPFIWSGAYASTYGSRFLNAAWADASGVEEMNLNYSFSGETSSLVESITENSKLYNGVKYDTSTVTLRSTPTEIDDENAVLLQKQAGKYYALQFTSNIVKDTTNFDALSFSPSLSHTGAQTEYLYSANHPSKQRIAMLLDGTWWRPEAKPAFDNMVIEMGNKYSMKNRNFGLMPFPKPTADMVGKVPSTYLASNECCAFVSAYCPKNRLELAKEFLQFCFTNQSMLNYTLRTDTSMPYTYTYESDEAKEEFRNGLTSFGRQMMDIHDAGNIVRRYSSNEKFINNYSYFSEDWDFRVAIEDYKGKFPFTAFHDYPSITAKKYFEGCYAYHQNNNLWK